MARLAGWDLLAPLPLYAVLAGALFRVAWGSPSAAVGYGPDPPFFIWSFGWFPFALSHGLNPFFSTHLDYPTGINLLASTSAPLLGILLWPVTVTWGPIVAYNVAVSAGLALSGWCAFLACRRLGLGLIASAIAGLVYEFSPFMVAHSLGHPHLVAALGPPLLILVLHDLVRNGERNRVRTGVMLGLVAAAQFYVSEELLAVEAVATLLGLVLLAALVPGDWKGRLKAGLAPATIAFGVFAALIAIPLGFQFLGPQHVGKAANPSGFYVADLLGLVTPTRLQWLAPPSALQVSDRFTGNAAESTAYIGIPLIAVALVQAIRQWRRLLVRFVAVLALLLGLLSMGPVLHVGGVITIIPVPLVAAGLLLLRTQLRVLPVLLAFTGVWVALAVGPIIGDILPGRFMVVVFLMLAVLVAAFVDSLGTATRPKRIAGVIAMAAALLALVPTISLPTTPFPVPVFFRDSLVALVPNDSVALIAPYAYDWDDVAMVWQAASRVRFRMPEGYGTLPGPLLYPAPTTLGHLMMAIDQGSPYRGITQRERLLADLHRWRVDAVIVGPMSNQAAMVQLFTDLLGRAPDSTGGVYAWSMTRPG